MLTPLNHAHDAHDAHASHDCHGDIDPLRLADFTATRRMLLLAAIAIGLGVIATYVAFHTLGVASIAVLVVGALIIGVIARYGSEKIRGHGIPEALEAILARGSRIEPRIALLKPIKARRRHLEDEQRRERILPVEYLLPRWLRPARPVVRDDPG